MKSDLSLSQRGFMVRLVNPTAPRRIPSLTRFHWLSRESARREKELDQKDRLLRLTSLLLKHPSRKLSLCQGFSPTPWCCRVAGVDEVLPLLSRRSSAG